MLPGQKDVQNHLWKEIFIFLNGSFGPDSTHGSLKSVFLLWQVLTISYFQKNPTPGNFAPLYAICKYMRGPLQIGSSWESSFCELMLVFKITVFRNSSSACMWGEPVAVSGLAVQRYEVETRSLYKDACTLSPALQFWDGGRDWLLRKTEETGLSNHFSKAICFLSFFLLPELQLVF